LTAVQQDHLIRSLTGQVDPYVGGLCGALNHGDNVARGYITIDTVTNCTPRFPGDPGYLAAGLTGDVTNQSQLTGEVYYVDPAHNVAYGGNLVPIHADSTNPATSTSGNYTFYGRYDSWTAVDNRQPLATTFAARFLSGPPGQFTHHVPPAPPHELHIGSTSLIVWRDSKVNQGYFTCPAIPGRPAWYPLDEEGVIAFDEQEHPQLAAGSLFTPASFPRAFPAETQIVKVGGSALPVSFQKGGLFLDLNTTVAAAGTNPPVDPAAAQAWVQVVEQDVHRTQSIMHDAQQLDTGTQPNHHVPGN
jgi:hypothetical protein